MTSLRDDDPSNRLFTINGAGGIGKTRLALEVASALECPGFGRVVVVSLATVRDPDLVGQAMLQAFGLPHRNGPDAL